MQTDISAIEHYDLAIILPSRNEEDSIGDVTRKVDQGLGVLGMQDHCVIINADNSPDSATRAAFLATPTYADKHSIATEGLGKGDNVLAGIRHGLGRGATRFCMFDTDLTSFDPVWVGSFLDQLRSGADVVTPVYGRKWIEGGTTNHCIAPALYALTGRWIPQPIAGDFAFTAELARRIADRPHTEDQRRYGIDILLTATSLFAGLQLGRLALKEKLHKDSFDKTKHSYMGAVSTLLRLVGESGVWPSENQPCDAVEVRLLDAPHLHPAKLQTRQTEARQTLRARGVVHPPAGLDENEWTGILEQCIRAAHTGQDGYRLAELLLPWFFLRTVTFLRDTPDAQAAEASITRQAHLLRRHLLAR